MHEFSAELRAAIAKQIHDNYRTAADTGVYACGIRFGTAQINHILEPSGKIEAQPGRKKTIPGQSERRSPGTKSRKRQTPSGDDAKAKRRIGLVEKYLRDGDRPKDVPRRTFRRWLAQYLACVQAIPGRSSPGRG